MISYWLYKDSELGAHARGHRICFGLLEPPRGLAKLLCVCTLEVLVSETPPTPTALFKRTLGDAMMEGGLSI